MNAHDLILVYVGLGDNIGVFETQEIGRLSEISKIRIPATDVLSGLLVKILSIRDDELSLNLVDLIIRSTGKLEQC